MTLDNICLEYGTYGKGDHREPAILFSRQGGDRVSDFLYKEHRILKGKPRSFSGLPESYGDKTQCSTLVVVLQEKASPIRLELSYTTFDHSDVIVRKAALTNDSNESIDVQRFASLQLDLPRCSWDLVTFDGAWARERYRHVAPLRPGTHVNDSKSGSSSARHNPCIFLTEHDGREGDGDCIGCNLV